MAVLWWLATGINQKMMMDVEIYFPGYPFWVPQLIQGEVPLDIDHVLFQLLLLGFGLITSTLSFICESLIAMYRKRGPRKFALN